MIVVSLDVRNRHPRADTVLVVPLTTSIHRDIPTHVYLQAGETGLQAPGLTSDTSREIGGPEDAAAQSGRVELDVFDSRQIQQFANPRPVASEWLRDIVA